MPVIPTNHDAMIKKALENKVNKIIDAEPGNIPIFSQEDQGSLKDSGKNISEISSGGGGGGDGGSGTYGAPALEILTAEVELKPLGTTKFSLKSTFKKFDLRTIRVKTDSVIRIYLYESYNDNPCYISIVENDIYDILNLPYISENLDGTLIGEIQNNSFTSEIVKIEIRVTSLQ